MLVVVLVHLDTDLGGDSDDVCALAMLLGWPEVDVVGITTVLDVEGRRAGCVDEVLRLADRTEIPVAAGAASTLGCPGDVWGDTANDSRYWRRPVIPRPSPPGAALDLLATSIEAGATVIGIGPYTNLANLETMRPGTLGDVEVVLMGGWFSPPPTGLPQWGPEMDFNVQADLIAARIVTPRASITMVPLATTLKGHLRARDLPRLRAAGALGELIARQAEAHGMEHDMSQLGRDHVGLPDDLLNFQYDPIACAVAVGWDGVTVETQSTRPVGDSTPLRFEVHPDGVPTRVVTDFNAERFNEDWLRAVERASSTSRA
jgi:inosine-uridine nucleoside N-ribohydrolase